MDKPPQRSSRVLFSIVPAGTSLKTIVAGQTLSRALQFPNAEMRGRASAGTLRRSSAAHPASPDGLPAGDRDPGRSAFRVCRQNGEQRSPECRFCRAARTKLAGKRVRHRTMLRQPIFQTGLPLHNCRIAVLPDSIRRQSQRVSDSSQ